MLLCAPGLRARIHHGVAHQLDQRDLPLVARVVTELTRGETGIDIHPGAQVGPGSFVDHGTGVVIGETTVVSAQVWLCQLVTLAATNLPTGAEGTLHAGLARHPIVEGVVVIYAGATGIGRLTVGRGLVIGGNVWLTPSVTPLSNMTQADTRSAPHPTVSPARSLPCPSPTRRPAMADTPNPAGAGRRHCTAAGLRRHGAHTMLRRFGVQATLPSSFGRGSTCQEIDRLVAVVSRLARA